MPMPSARSSKLDIRITPAAKQILQHAAREKHKTISEFVLDTALTAAAEVLAERNHIGMTTEQWVEFRAGLDAPPRSHVRMKRMLTEPTILD